jgi:hypothetical protein
MKILKTLKVLASPLPDETQSSPPAPQKQQVIAEVKPTHVAHVVKPSQPLPSPVAVNPRESLLKRMGDNIDTSTMVSTPILKRGFEIGSTTTYKKVTPSPCSPDKVLEEERLDTVRAAFYTIEYGDRFVSTCILNPDYYPKELKQTLEAEENKRFFERVRQYQLKHAEELKDRRAKRTVIFWVIVFVVMSILSC